MWSQFTNVTDRQTDRQTTCDRNTALCTKVHRAVKNYFMIIESQFRVRHKQLEVKLTNKWTISWQEGGETVHRDVCCILRPKLTRTFVWYGYYVSVIGTCRDGWIEFHEQKVVAKHRTCPKYRSFLCKRKLESICCMQYENRCVWR